MSDNWSMSLLLQPGHLSHDETLIIGKAAAAAGLVAGALKDGHIVCMSGDGYGSVIFERLEAALSWLARSDGLVPFHLPSVGEEVDMSVQRRWGTLSVEMGARPDTRLFDEISITLSASSFSRAGEPLWSAVRTLMVSLIDLLPVELAYGAHEAALELELRYMCVHRSLQEGRIAPFVAWITSVPTTSPLAASVRAVHEAVGGEFEEVNGLISLQLTDRPWDSPVEAVTRASAIWRRSSGDAACN